MRGSVVRLLLAGVADGFEQAAVVEPVDPFEGGILHGFEAAPWASPVDEFGIVEAVDRLGQADRDILAAAIGS